MSLSDLSANVRYAGVLAVVITLAVLTAWRILRAPVNPAYLFLVPCAALVLAGIEWDRIFLHDKSL
ncbi:MAG: hypothetical protein ABEJ78_02005 [Haloferacaceae archaeon]